MSSVGPQNPTAAVNTTVGASDTAWTSPTNVFADDGSYATCVPSSTFLTSKAIDCSGFDFSTIPNGSTIVGIVVEVDRKVTSTTKGPKDQTVQLLLASVASGSNYADTTNNWPTTQAYKTYGTGTTDLWGLTPSLSDIQNSGFGVRFRIKSDTSGVGQPTYSVDHIRITVYYTESGVAYDAVSNSGGRTASTYSWSHTCTGTNRFLAVDVSTSGTGDTVTGITYNGVALSLIGTQVSGTGVSHVESWGLANPASGTNTIAVTLSAIPTLSVGLAVSYTGVHQSSPTEAFNSATAVNGLAADATVTVTTVAANDWVHGAISTTDTAITANQTSRNNLGGAGGSAANEDTGPQVSPGTVTISYTDVGAAQTWVIAGYAIRPSSAVTPATILFPLISDAPQILRATMIPY